ncbi:MAG: hypothetical protein ABSE82_08270 [Nitrososphaerales archaeon]|jgi:predicted transcriptional regulator
MTIADDFTREHYEDKIKSQKRRVKILKEIYEAMSRNNVSIDQRIRFKKHFQIEQEIADLRWYEYELKQMEFKAQKLTKQWLEEKRACGEGVCQ